VSPFLVRMRLTKWIGCSLAASALLVGACSLRSLAYLGADADGSTTDAGDDAGDDARGDALTDAGPACTPDEASVGEDAGDMQRYARCGDASGVDLVTNSANCGRCGHDCQGTSCSGGLCAKADRVAQGVIGSATDGVQLYDLENADGGGWLAHAVPLDGGPPVPIGSTPMTQVGAYQQALLVGSDAVYASFEGSNANGYVFRQPLDGGPLGTFILPSASPGGVALAPGTIAYTSPPDMLVAKADFADGGFAEIAAGRSQNLGGIATSLDMSRVFWVEQPAQMPWTLFVFTDGPHAIDMDGNLSQYDSFAVDDQYLYVAETGAGKLVRLPITATTTTTPEVVWEDSNFGGLGSVAVDADHVYWFAYRLVSQPCVLFKKAKCGGALTVVVDSEPWAPGELVPVGGNLYWTASSGALRRVAK
jgi:hypothetical protein